MNVIKINIFFIIIGLTVLNISIAKVEKGNPITAKQVIGDTFNIGDIQESILSELQFIGTMGSCWKLLNTNTSIIGTPLSNEIGNILPNASGKFLRNAGPLSAPVGSEQGDDLKEHTHWVSSAPRDDGNGSYSNSNTQMFGLAADSSSYLNYDHNSVYGRYTDYSTNHPETRPVSFIVNMFVKVSNDCE